jgi:hypothetical protein
MVKGKNAKKIQETKGTFLSEFRGGRLFHFFQHQVAALEPPGACGAGGARRTAPQTTPSIFSCPPPFCKIFRFTPRKKGRVAPFF